ncbi:MAG: J domain-containing protein [Rhodothermaceae bacterium]|nr:J domain-containing protein [Rhodothermaceae bacterium]
MATLWWRSRGTSTASTASRRHWTTDDHAARIHQAYFAKERKARAIRQRERQARERRTRTAQHTDARFTTEPPEPETADSPSMRLRHTEARYRAVLHLEGEITETSLRRAYLRLIAAYHPDRVAGLGIKLQHLAEEETKRINEAYTFFRDRYNF